MGIVLVALMLTDGQPSNAQGDEGCHFLMHLRQPIEFTGPAGGYDFELYRPTKYDADIYLANVYGDRPCNWHATTNQSWLDLSRTSGEIAGGDDTFITVSINVRGWEVIEPDNPDPMNTLTPEPPPEPQNLRVDVEVIGLSPNSDALVSPTVTLPPATSTPMPSPTPEPVAVANAVQP